MPLKVIISTSSFDVAGNEALRAPEAAALETTGNPFKRRLTEDEVIALLREGAAGMIAGVEPLTERVFQNAPALKVISRVGTGLDNVDLPAAKEHGIQVFNTPDAPTDAVVELAVGHMLALLRHINRADRAMRSGAWNPLMGALLAEQIVGIVGYGRIGRRLGGLLHAGFGAHVIFYDPHVAGAQGPADRCATLEELLQKADVVSLHLPNVESGTPLIGDRELGLMKEGAILVNTARGGLVDLGALEKHLAGGRLAGAGLDVYDHEPYAGGLLKCENAVLTMHMGSYAREVRKRMEHEAARNLLDGLRRAGLI